MLANLENNFWKEYYGLNFHSVFNKLYENDKSKDKEKSSKIMWAIFLLVNPDSNLYNDPNKEDAIIKNYLKDSKFKWDDYEDIIYAYKDVVLTTAEKALQNWNELMIMRDKHLKAMYKSAFETKDEDGVSLTSTTLKNLDAVLSSTPKMFADYAKIKKEYEEEKTHKKGKSVGSLSDSDVI